MATLQIPLGSNFSDAFWDDQYKGVDIISSKLKRSKETCEEIKRFYESRAQIEQEYGEKLLKLSATSTFDKYEEGSFAETLSCIPSALETTARAHIDLSQQLRGHLEMPLNEFLKEQREIRKTNKKANFDPTHELDELQLQDKTPKINMKNSKRNMDASHLDRSRQISNDQELLEQSPERQMMEDKFLAYDYSKPEENENRRRMAEQKHWAQKMNKTTGHSNRKAGGTYKASVLDYLNQKPPPPLTASDILKLEELARSAKANTSKDKTNEWRPPSGLLNYNDMDGFSIEAVKARNDYILQQGGNPPPTRPPPFNYKKENDKDRYDSNNVSKHADSSYQEARTRSSDDSSCPLVTFPNDSERYLIESAASIEKADEATISMLNDDYVVKYSASVKSTTSNNSYYTKSSRNY
ncbi:hypothetical protein G6F55_009465 [Rhizopus delemar]|nr:hypothetical protein G6F55_009465 [Rhizopus delemar]